MYKGNVTAIMNFYLSVFVNSDDTQQASSSSFTESFLDRLSFVVSRNVTK